MKQQIDIKVQKTARYFILGTPSEKITSVWFVCHGYAQLAKYFINWLEPVANENTLIVAPEGLNRFYWEGFSGNVVASWMTKENRQTDIDDYVKYLDTVANTILKDLKNVKINILGFSQGAGTATRWSTLGKISPDNLILWAGSFPSDIDYFENKEQLQNLRLHIVIGDNDEFMPEEKIQEKLADFNKKGIQHNLIRFNGGHKILPKPLLELQKSLSK